MHFKPAVIAFLLFSFFRLGAAQQTTGSINGTVTASDGTPIKGARVAIISESTGAERRTAAGPNGRYLFALVPAGNYEISAQAADYYGVREKGIPVSPDSVLTVNLELSKGVAETIVVEGAPNPVDATTGTLRQIVDTRKISELPIPDRNVTQLALLAAGTADQSNSGITTGGGEQARVSGQSAAVQVAYPGTLVISSGGGRSDSVDYILDGINNRDIYLNTGGPLPNPDAIQEVVIQFSNISAEFHSAVGGVVLATTRSGSNKLHGSAFEFLQNDALNATPFFNNMRGGGKDIIKRNQFGGTAGGPLIKDKLFFFGSYEGMQLRKAATRTRFVVFNDAQRAGIFGGTSVPVDPVAAALMQYIPRAENQNTGELFINKGQPEHENQYLARFDLAANRNQIFGKYFSSNYIRDLSPGLQNNLYVGLPGYDFRAQSTAAGLNSILSSSLVNSLTLGWSRLQTFVSGASPIGMNDLNPNVAGIKEINIVFGGGFSSINFLGRDRQLKRQTLQANDGAHWIRGRHDVAFGGEVSHSSLYQVSLFRQAGFYTFASPQNFILGNVKNLQQGGGEFTDKGYYNIGLYINDSVRISSRLNLSLGMRWDPFKPPVDKDLKAMCFVSGAASKRFPNAPAGILFAGEPGCPDAGFSSTWTDFAPRLGFAYDLSGSARTVLRGGAGLAYQSPFLESLNNMVAVPPFSPQVSLANTKLDDPYGFLGLTNPFPQNFGPRAGSPTDTFQLPVVANSYEAAWKPGRAWNYNLTLEHEILSKLMVRAAYVGASGDRLGYNTDVNITPLPFALAHNIRPNPDFGSMIQNQSRGQSDYSALQVGITRSSASGPVFEVHYTWSKSLDNVSSVSDLNKLNVFHPLDPLIDWAVSDFDLRSRLVANVVWDIKNPLSGRMAQKVLSGWQVSSIFSVQSGSPFSVVSNNNISDNFEGNNGQVLAIVTARPSLTGGSKNDRIQQWFETTAFSPTPDGYFGTSPRNILTGPGQFLLDVAVCKTTNIRENVRLQYRAEFFNALNHANFYLPDNNAGRVTAPNPDFGKITNALDPRNIQMALKLVF